MKKMIVSIGIVFIFTIMMFGFFSKKPIEIKSNSLSQSFLSKDIPIIDIRTSKEWKETGVLKGSHLITFYNRDKKTFDESGFIQKLKHVVRKWDSFAILSQTGNRSEAVTHFLISKGFPNVINLSGGIKLAEINGIELLLN